MPESTRRTFLQTTSTSAAALAATGSLSALRAASPVHQGEGKLKIGVVGTGGRGTGAAVNALKAHPENVLWAVGDAFMDRTEGALGRIGEAMGQAAETQVDVPPERRFGSVDCMDKVLDTGVDVVVLASPPGFRPMQIEKAVAKGVHIFAEKPIASDAPGIRRVRAACEEAKKKNLTVVSGLCYRYHDGRRAIVEKLQGGAIGDILAIQGNYVTGELWHRGRKPEWSEMEYQLRNWLYFPWLSGDLIAEQHIHTLDVMAWIKKDVYPAAAASLGGRQKRTGEEYGAVYDHFATIYEWEDGTRGFSYCRQQSGCWNDLNEYVIGTKGKANVFKHAILGPERWRYSGQVRSMYQNEHDEMFAAIRAGETINNGEYMCNSTQMALMGRLAAYTGRRLTWDQVGSSQEVLMPDEVTLDMTPPPSAVAVPGLTKFS